MKTAAVLLLMLWLSLGVILWARPQLGSIRCIEVTKRITWAPNSVHMEGVAVLCARDWQISDTIIPDLEAWNGPLEFHSPKEYAEER